MVCEALNPGTRHGTRPHNVSASREIVLDTKNDAGENSAKDAQ
jgi:hypothetical protein